MNFPITRIQLQTITKEYERIHRQNYIKSAVEYIKRLIIDKAYNDSPNKSPALIPRVINESDTLYSLQFSLPLNFPLMPIAVTNYYYPVEKLNELLPEIVSELKALFLDIDFRVTPDNLIVDWY